MLGLALLPIFIIAVIMWCVYDVSKRQPAIECSHPVAQFFFYLFAWLVGLVVVIISAVGGDSPSNYFDAILMVTGIPILWVASLWKRSNK